MKLIDLLSNLNALNVSQGSVVTVLYSLFTNGCNTSYSSVKISKFADDTKLVGLNTNSDETGHKWGMSE